MYRGKVYCPRCCNSGKVIKREAKNCFDTQTCPSCKGQTVPAIVRLEQPAGLVTA